MLEKSKIFVCECEKLSYAIWNFIEDELFSEEKH